MENTNRELTIEELEKQYKEKLKELRDARQILDKRKSDEEEKKREILEKEKAARLDEIKKLNDQINKLVDKYIRDYGSIKLYDDSIFNKKTSFDSIFGIDKFFMF